MDTGQMYAEGGTQNHSFAKATGAEQKPVRRSGRPCGSRSRGSRSRLSEAAYMELVPDGVRVGFKKEGRGRDGAYHLLLMEAVANQFLEGKKMPPLHFEVGSDEQHHLIEVEFVPGNAENATFQPDGIHTSVHRGPVAGTDPEETVIPAEKVLSMTIIW